MQTYINLVGLIAETSIEVLFNYSLKENFQELTGTSSESNMRSIGIDLKKKVKDGTYILN